MIGARVPNPAAVDDLAQEAILAALTSLRAQMPLNPENPGAYLYGVAKNVVNAHFRRQGRERTEELGLAESIPDHNVVTRERELVRDARREIERLDGADREVLDLTLIEGLEPTEIAARLGIAAATVRQRKSRAMKRLIERLSLRSRPGPLQQ
jgi:RNA polymerase sigma-70 factor (ECF subfamily)